MSVLERRVVVILQDTLSLSKVYSVDECWGTSCIAPAWSETVYTAAHTGRPSVYKLSRIPCILGEVHAAAQGRSARRAVNPQTDAHLRENALRAVDLKAIL